MEIFTARLTHIGHSFLKFSLISFKSERKICIKVKKLNYTELHTNFT